jgi:serine/threonine-protein kinase RsbW
VKQHRQNIRNLEIMSRTDMLSDVRAFVSGAAKEFGFGADDVAKIELAVDEACTNIIKHAYRFDPAGKISIQVAFLLEKSPRFVVSIFDNGMTFDSTKYTAPDMKEYFMQLRHGGLGILLMKKLMDNVEYMNSPTDGNLIVLTKFLSPSPGVLAN